jgi:hypothetical protein
MMKKFILKTIIIIIKTMKLKIINKNNEIKKYTLKNKITLNK